MKVITAENPDDGLKKAWQWLKYNGEDEDSRAGKVLVSPMPVTTIWPTPKNRVSTCPVRDANPFFHLYEALWMLEGHNNAKMLDEFVSDFSERFAEAGGIQHGAYGHRWKSWFTYDQLEACIKRLKNEPTSRQVVLTMWDPRYDFHGDWKDRPCNTHIYFRRRAHNVIDMTVCCRSNDVFWGTYGANIVHMSLLLEYVCAKVGCFVGTYYQVSNNFHIYHAVKDRAARVEVKDTTPTKIFYSGLNDDDIRRIVSHDYGNTQSWAFKDIVAPMFQAYEIRKTDPEKALAMLLPDTWDWHFAAYHWIKRRMK